MTTLNEKWPVQKNYVFPVLVAITIGVTVWLCSTTLLNNVDIAVMKNQMANIAQQTACELAEIKETLKEIRKDQVERKRIGYPEYQGVKK